MQISFKKSLLLSLFFISLILSLVVLIQILNTKVSNLHTQEYIDESLLIKERLQELIEHKQKATMAISLSLSKGNLIHTILQNRAKNSSSLRLESLVQELKANTNYQNVWIHILDERGVSILRSWTNSTQKETPSRRAEIQDLLKKPRPLSMIDIDSYTLAFKAIVPVYNKSDILLGFVETITHINSISKELEKSGYDSLVLVDKSYESTLTNTVTQSFLDGYYVANFSPKRELMKLISDIGIQKSTQIESYLLDTHSFLTSYTLKDSHNMPLAYFILIKDIESFTYKEKNDFLLLLKQFMIAGSIILAVVTLLFFRRYQKMQREHKYLQNVLNTSSEIIIIINEEKILDVNQAFLDFFDDYNSLDEIRNSTLSISDFFIQEKGYISHSKSNRALIKTIQDVPKRLRKVKLFHKDKVSIFTINVQRLLSVDEMAYTLTLTNITEIEEYKVKLEQLSQTDALTGIRNRHYFIEHINKEIARTIRYKKPFSLLMLDIDHFKNINDTYGHDIGDIALVAFTERVTSLVRSTDTFCRYGGEEFMIIIPESSLLEAQLTAQRIRKKVAKLDIEEVGHITISIGVTQLQEKESVESILKRVDEALYLSKESGRNRVTTI